MGRATVECTTENKLGGIDEFDCTCATLPVHMPCPIDTALRRTPNPLTMRRFCGPPPLPPLHKGGKGSRHRQLARQKRTLSRRLSNPVNHNFSPPQPRPPGIVQRSLALAGPPGQFIDGFAIRQSRLRTGLGNGKRRGRVGPGDHSRGETPP